MTEDGIIQEWDEIRKHFFVIWCFGEGGLHINFYGVFWYDGIVKDGII